MDTQNLIERDNDKEAFLPSRRASLASRRGSMSLEPAPTLFLRASATINAEKAKKTVAFASDESEKSKEKKMPQIARTLSRAISSYFKSGDNDDDDGEHQWFRFGNQQDKFLLCLRDDAFVRYYFFTLAVPVFFTMVYAIAILFPPSYREKVPWLLWTDGALKKNDDGMYSICPRASICSEGVVEIILISISRLTAFASYTLMAQTFLSKMHCTLHYLSTTYLGKIVPFAQLHHVHTLNGRWFAILAILHTVGHFIRWIKRSDMKLLGTQVGVSGLIAIVAMITIVWAMSGQQERKTRDQMSKVERIKNFMNRTRGAKWVRQMTFEKRFNLHYYFMFILVAALLAHTPRCAIITAVFVGLWILDYTYGLLFKTFRLDLVEFTPLPNNSGVQMLWKNPIGFHANSGEYVKVQLPWLERQGSEWHPFSVYMKEATSEGMYEVLYGRNRLEAQEKEVITTSTALVLIEFQNEFAHVNGKLHEGVEEVMELTDMIENVKRLTEVVRSNGGKIIHVPYTWNKDELSNPQRHVGILKGIRAGKFFQEGTWNAEFFEGFEPKIADIVVKGKTGLDGFVDTDLQSQLSKHGIKTMIVAGYLTNMCVESTVRSAYERGYNVITLTDGTACTSQQEQEAACRFSFPMFSQPMTCAEAQNLVLSKKPRKIRDTSLRQSNISQEYSELDQDSDDEELFSVDAEWQTNLECFIMHVYNLNKKKNLKASIKEEHLILAEAREDLRSQYETTQIFVVPAGDWTKNMYKEVSERKQLRSCWVRGPFVSPYSVASNFSNLVLIATGIGITPALGVIGQYKGASRFKTLIWSTRCPRMLKFFAPLLKDCNLAIIYYTGKEILTDKEVLKLMSYGSIFIQRSRPDSLTKSTSTVISTTESLHSHEKYSSLDSLPLKTKQHWCLFYCGGSVGICEMFKSFSKENNINFEYELFDCLISNTVQRQVPFEESVEEAAEEEPEQVHVEVLQENDTVQRQVPFEESVEEAAEEEPEHVHVEELQENDTVQRQVPFEKSVEEAAEEELEQVHVEELQENDSIEVEELGSGFATDAAGRVRRFSHRLKGKSRKVYKF